MFKTIVVGTDGSYGAMHAVQIAADAHALTLLAREQERIPAARVDFHLAAAGSPSKPGSPPAGNEPISSCL